MGAKRALGALGPDTHLAYGEPFAQLHEASLAEKIARGGLGQEIDVEIGSDRQLFPPDLGKNCDIERDIRQSEDRRSRNRAPRAATGSDDRLGVGGPTSAQRFRPTGRRQAAFAEIRRRDRPKFLPC